jgi:SAM-dependent methyltransferase
MGFTGRQFGCPSGLPGRLVGGLMARGNRAFNVEVASRLGRLAGGAERIAEVGCGPGVGLAALLRQFPEAHVVGIDLSPEMLAQSSARNAEAVRSGRLTLRRGGIEQLDTPVDLIVAVHVLYFWHQPVEVLGWLRRAVTEDGLVALGYRCRPDMPSRARHDFPREGHLLYEVDSQVRGLFAAAGFQTARSVRIDATRMHLGWLTVAGP